MINQYIASEGQTVFDVGINIYTNLDNIIKLLQSSDIDNINESELNQKVVNYDTDLISDRIIYTYIFSKRKRFNTGKIITTVTERRLLGTGSGAFIITDFGYKILI